MNPNGRWYRQCQTGYYYSYFFGLKGMVIDEDFDFLSSGSQYAAVNEWRRNLLAGRARSTRIKARTGSTPTNTLLGFQTGGKLEYRFCRWTLDTHGNAGMFLNIAHQDSRIQTSFGGPTRPTLADGTIAGASPEDAIMRSAHRAASSLLPAGSAWREATSSCPTSSGTYPTT